MKWYNVSDKTKQNKQNKTKQQLFEDSISKPDSI